jgi:hypothetical protein
VRLFDLASNSDRRVQNGALASLKQSIRNPRWQESLEKANIVFLLKSLSANQNPEAVNFVAFALPLLAVSLAQNGHVSAILHLLGHDEPKIREGACDAITVIANGSEHDQRHLLDEDLLERLTRTDERLGQIEQHLASLVIPKLAFNYLRSGKLDLIITLVE